MAIPRIPLIKSGFLTNNEAFSKVRLNERIVVSIIECASMRILKPYAILLLIFINHFL